ncbi:MAG: hypothetical protein ABT940_13490 [Alphaproteobacteria bacterium]
MYALTTQTPEESVSRDFIHADKADIWINVLDPRPIAGAGAGAGARPHPVAGPVPVRRQPAWRHLRRHHGVGHRSILCRDCLDPARQTTGGCPPFRRRTLRLRRSHRRLRTPGPAGKGAPGETGVPAGMTAMARHQNRRVILSRRWRRYLDHIGGGFAPPPPLPPKRTRPPECKARAEWKER